MNPLALKMLLLIEVRLRMRRAGTLVAVLALIVLTWLMVGDPAKGQALLVVGKVRVAYTSSCLALGGAGLGGLFLGLAGFYLVRGRMSEDARSGAGSVLAATQVSNAVFLFGRWLGAVAYLCGLLAIFLLTMLVLHMVRGDGPIQLWVYLQAFALTLLPLVFFTAAMAVLCDAWAPLMGKRGDVLYFVFYITQMTVPIIATTEGAGWSPLLLLDFSGLGATVTLLRSIIQTDGFVLGGGEFDPALPALVLPQWLWTGQMGFTRLGCAVFAMLPLLPALLVFHRFAPDRVKVRSGGPGGWSRLMMMGRLFRPLTKLVRPLFGVASRVPGIAGYALAVLALTFASNPAAIAAALGLLVAGIFAPATALGGLTTGAIALWGILVSDVSVRDRAHDVDAMSAAVPGGSERRFAAQLLASCLLALVFAAPVLVRWLLIEPTRGVALLTGVLMLAAAASLLGRLSRTPRVFLALFLFGLYVATQVVKSPSWDVVGFNGVATTQSVAIQALAGALLLALGSWHEKWRSARN
jgi:hypothetical protein